MPETTATYEAAISEMQRLMGQQGLNSLGDMFPVLIIALIFSLMVMALMAFIVYRIWKNRQGMT